MSEVHDNARQILEYLRARGGKGKIESKKFDMTLGEYYEALYLLKTKARIRRLAPRIWEVMEWRE